jgi:nucleoside-diphosphate-sugar epimerase
VGETFNVSNDVRVSQREFLNRLADAVGAKHVRRKLPFRTAYAVATFLEASYRLLRIKQRPLITRQSMSLIGLSQIFATDKITDRLGWQPRVGLETGLERIREWWIEVEGVC